MSYRQSQLAAILLIQEEIDSYSYIYVSTGSLHAYSNYTRLVSELTNIKLAILTYEQRYGYNG